MPVTTPCRSCLPADCEGGTSDFNPYGIYSLQVPPYFSVFNCPAGYDCSQSPFIIMTCCGETFQAELIGLTQPQRTQVINAILTACARNWEFCGEVLPPGGGDGGGPIGGGGGGGGGPLPPILPPPPPALFFNVPQSCQVICPNGNVFTAYVGAAWTLGFTQAAANAAAHTYACLQATNNRACLGTFVAEACLDTAFNERIRLSSPSGATAIYAITSGALPDGLTLSGNGGTYAIISGTPTVAGSFTFTITATTANGVCTGSYTINIIGIATASPLPDATQGVAYSQTLTAAGSATPPLSWQVIAGTLPPGLTLNEETGVISGIPTTNSLSYPFTIRMQTEAT